MDYPIVNSSPQALEKITSFDDMKGIDTNTPHHRTKYPFDLLHIGQSFTVPIAEANEASLRMTASNHGKKRGKKFSVFKHVQYQCIEIARIA